MRDCFWAESGVQRSLTSKSVPVCQGSTSGELSHLMNQGSQGTSQPFLVVHDNSEHIVYTLMYEWYLSCS
eukprot:jgi/Botrbrau1/6694/Bobra.0202s0032.1